MDPLTTLLNEHPPQQLSVTELRSGLELLEDAARACRAALESRTTTLDGLPDEIQQDIFGRLCNALDPRSAVAYSSASKGLRELMQRVGEGAGRSPLQQLKEENAEAAALCLNAWGSVGKGSCKNLREAKWVVAAECNDLSAADLATLVKLIPTLPALEKLRLDDWPAPAGPDCGQRLVEGLCVGGLPALTHLWLGNMCVGDAGASALAAALYRGAMPRLKGLGLANADIGDAGLAALAPALRWRPALERLVLYDNPFGDEGLAALVDAPPPQAEVLPKLRVLYLDSTQITDAGCAHLASRLRSGAPQAEVLAQLKRLNLSFTQIADDGCAHLASGLRSGALPALECLDLDDTPASEAAKDAVYEARADLHGCEGWEESDDEEGEEQEGEEGEEGEKDEEGEEQEGEEGEEGEEDV